MIWLILAFFALFVFCAVTRVFMSIPGVRVTLLTLYIPACILLVQWIKGN